MSLPERLADFVRTAALPLPGERPVLLAVSGGLDSVTLARLFRLQGWPFAVAHCNFQLRGAESDGDEAFVRALAAGWGVSFFVKKFDTGRFARQNGLSVQMAARRLRYAWFEEIREAHDFDSVVTAHHLNDSLETVLLNFARGTGLRGLGGIPARQGRVVRPLLFAAREEILAFAREQGLDWREDRSNAADDYARNYLRHHVVPHFLALNPNFLHTAARSLSRLRAAAANLDFFLKKLGEISADGAYKIDKQKLMQLPAPDEALRDLLKPFGFTAEQTRQMAAHPGEIGREWSAPTGARLLNDRGCFVVTAAHQTPAPLRIEADDLLLKLPDGTRLALTPAAAGAPFPDGREAVLVDADKLQFPLLLRPWQPGDAFQPLGMDGRHQKIQDYFTNHKVSRLDKERSWLLVNGDAAIIWLLGWRPDERFRIRETTRNALKMSWIR